MILRARLVYFTNDKEISNYRWFRVNGTPTAAQKNTITQNLYEDWAGAWASQSAWDLIYRRVHVDWFTDGLVDTTAKTEYGVNQAGTEGVFSQTFKQELCVGIVTTTTTMRRRIYRAGIPADYVTSTGELLEAGRLAMENADVFLALGWNFVNVSLTRHVWELVDTLFVQPELQSHNHRKVHVPLGSEDILPG